MRRSLALLIALLTATAADASAQMRPQMSWRQIESTHFRVVYEAGLDSIAQHAARRAEAAYTRLITDLSRPPKGKIDIMIGDNMDLANGGATPFPSNRIYLWARPPVDEPGLGFYNDWMDLVISHELTHIFHMDRAGKVGRALRTVFGRLPFGWPIFPVLGTPGWTLEGLATYRESVQTGRGRVYGTNHEMVLRTAILEHKFDPLDRINGATPIWPGGQRDYIYGSMFMSYVAERPGPESHRELLNKTSGSVLPPPWVLDRLARKATGKTFSTLYREWRYDLQKRYGEQASRLRAAGLTAGERIAGGERFAIHPRISPNGNKLAYVEEDGRNSSMHVILDLATRQREKARRNSMAPLAWANDATLYTTQPELIDPYTIYTDLYSQTNGDQTRITRGARYEAVDVDRAGRKLVMIVNGRGMTSIVQRDLATGAERVIMPQQPDVHWALPRWSPDGQRIVAQRWRLGGYQDIVVMDTLGTPVQRASPWLHEESAFDATPAWSADGSYVIFSSDRSGINNLYAYNPTDTTGAVFQVTNVLTGVFYPDVSSDGQWIYYSAYHATGYSIERLRYDVNAWRAVEYSAAPDSVTVVVPEQTGTPLRVRNYSALRSALPKFWVPIFEGDSIQGDFFGVFTSGTDDINRHEYALEFAHNFANGRSLGFFDYTFAGFGNPLISFSASREYDTLTPESIRREDNLSLLATYLRPRWRSSMSFALGVEGVQVRRDTTSVVLDPEDRLLGVIAGLGYTHTRNPAYSISREDGARGSVFVRRRFDLEPVFRDATYTEVTGALAGYKSIDASGFFAHHVVAARGIGVYRTGLGIGPTDVGGVNNSLPVRGFEEPDRIGFRAWSASLEYRLPIAMIGRGVRMWPFFVDRVAATAFVDAGNAYCTDEQRAIYRACPGNPDRGEEMLLSIGAEVSSNVAILTFIPAWVRLGVAQPVQGPRDEPRVYFSVGPSF